MINNTAPRKTLAAVLAVGMAAGLTGCGSTVAANTNDYFTNVSSILHTLQSNGSQQDAASSSTADAGNQLLRRLISRWTKTAVTALPA